MLWTSPIYRNKKYAQKGSFFEECDRDDKGHCKPSGQSGESAKPDEDKGDSEHVVGENSHGDHLTGEASEALNKSYENVDEAGIDYISMISNLLSDVDDAVDDDVGEFDSDEIDSVGSKAEVAVEQAADEARKIADKLIDDVSDHLRETFAPEDGDEDFDIEFDDAEQEFKLSVEEAHAAFVEKCQVAKEALDDYIIIRTTTNDDDPKEYEKNLNDAIRDVNMNAGDEFRSATAKAAEAFFKRVHEASPYDPPKDEEDKGLESSPIYKDLANKKSN